MAEIPFEPYTGQGKLRFWCQKVLPLVYDDSLSYYELLGKVVEYLNNTITDVGACEDNITALRDAFVQLQDYVNEMLEDFSPEVERIIDEMVDSGEFGEILSGVINGVVASEYNETTQYSEFDYCLKDGKLYCATESTSGTWDSTKWRETSLGNDLQQLSETLNNLNAGQVSYDNNITYGNGTVGKELNSLNETSTLLQNKFPATSCDSLSDFITKVTRNPNGTIGLISGTSNLSTALHSSMGNCIVLYRYIQNTNRILYTCCTLDNVVCGYVSITGNAAYSEIDMHYAARNLFNLKNSSATVRLVGAEGEYQTIQSACDAANVDDIIIVLPGIYTEQVSIFGKKLHIIGVDKNLCTIIDHTGNYNTPPVEMNIGTLANFTIIEDASQPSADETDFQAYCIHNDSPTNVDGETLEIANCNLINARHSCIGFGLYSNYTVYIHDCHMRKNSTDSGEYKYGCLYVHGSTRTNSTNQNLIVENCTISSAGDYAARVGIPGTGSGEVNARFIGNKMWSDINGTTDNAAVISSRTNYPFTLDKSCSGNTIDKFNIAPDYTIGTGVDLTNYGQENYFVVPSDGYVLANVPASAGVIYRIYGKANSPYIYNTIPADAGVPVFVRKNMRIEIRSVFGGATVTYYPLYNI